VATGKTREETLERIAKAVAMHIKGMEEDGLAIPEPTVRAEYLTLEQAS